MSLVAEITPTMVDVEPGVPAEFTVSIHNTTDVIAGYEVRVLGLDPTWVEIDPRPLSLFPDSSGDVTVRIEIPADYPAGRRQLAVQVSSIGDESDFELLQVSIQVPVMERLGIDVEPGTITAGSRAEYGIVLTNRGNAPRETRVVATDGEDRLTFDLEPPVVLLAPGEQEIVRARVKGRPPWFGAPEARIINLGIDATDPPVEAVATFVQRPRIGRWVLTLAGLLAAAAVFAVVLTRSFEDVVDTAKVDEDLLLEALDSDAGVSGVVPTNPAVISGSVLLSSSGLGVSGVTVELFDEGDANLPVATAATNDEGAYQLGNLEGGTYVVKVSGAGFDDFYYEDAPSFDLATPVEVELGETAEGIDVVLAARPGSISGRIIADDPVGAFVTLFVPGASIDSASDAQVLSADVGADGAFSFEDVPSPATYSLVVEKAGFAAETIPVQLGASEDRDGIEIVLRQGDGVISGLVTGPGGPLGAVAVTATDGVDIIRTVTLTTGEVGGFAIRGLSTPATYNLSFTRPGFGDASLTVTLGAAEQRSGLEINLVGGTGSIAGRVTFADGSPAGGVSVTVVSGETVRSTTTLTADIGAGAGSYLLDGLPMPGTYVVTFSRAGYENLTRSVDLDPFASTILTGVDATISSATAVFRGSVSDAGGPLGGVQITLSDGARTFTSRSADDPPGRFEIASIPPGTYTATFSRPGSAVRTEIVPLGAADVRTIDIVLEEQARISGRVTTGDPGSPIPLAGAEVRLYRLPDFPSVAPVAVLVTDTDGRYEFVGLTAPDTYVVELALTQGGPGVASTAVTLGAGENRAGVDLHAI